MTNNISLTIQRAMIDLRMLKEKREREQEKAILPNLNVTTRFLELLGRACPTCSIAFADPDRIDSCKEMGNTCWEQCPVCYPEQYGGS